ncbi:DNA gyrase inhibitor YacG [Malonomonas rubra]|uniref:DNA gyrase inhibitor YacG n=1 Tax=Malonomonas rubra TaxID=57040 RepID=UPI0009339FD3|nr:DNA gyrase inhibitor YacG [Malonomonas rubra]
MTNLKVKCPRCGAETAWQGNESRPFCSENCRMVDLGNWANEEYAIDGGKAPQRDMEDDLHF